MYYAYILCCSDNSFYTGHSKALKQRHKQHCRGEVQATKNKRPVKLIYYEKFPAKQEAMSREKQIKGWSRIKKYNLVKYGHPTKIEKHKI
ncbi:hypothetical protein A2303_01000 [Candidatus Falkowbacteria bacterium RIFOXYB2_FULL_47_14]|uniref:GIY-YIG domain-containing protein n=1 Tax=Candidatus Falkowbacteria bacterium RIFOXYA2_FULL_47_19 TaxID=1797994 RepID=A0A1F5SG35_9BACT|nr:MAG: hypothetical protein A2227_00200 [Candidatus Falkowbacteria bacterium RIFOXYA2_FULL_47_19]OGF35574.1 MAG: hypothetical protein A2468_06075 [Candidatus Falkowbacteria bacterium RIFOXYC2_FULL_46_15]OGF42942.1 MAG: hypothetical protein A2303_01000 [Candidatus Falkowbacteria bacterium RIFOXYB2_FULL_47_14]